MEYSDCDFWGLTVNQEQYLPHLQSYFLVFNKKIINSEIFKNFFRKVKREDNKQNIIENYEIALTSSFLDAGFKMDSFIKKIFERNPTFHYSLFHSLIENDFPFLKVSSITNQPLIRKKIFKNYLKNNSLLELIDSHTKRIGRKEFFKLNFLILKIKNNGEYIVTKFFGFKIFEFKIIKD
jgi:rhamnosyltransferase